jgi:hypothetical protein
VLLPLSIAAWLTGRNQELSGRPIDVRVLAVSIG